MIKARHKEQGFTLVEVLVAFAIVSVSLGILLSAFSNASTALDGMEARRAAILIAQSRLAGARPENPGRPEVVSGQEGPDFDWEVRFEPYGSTALRDDWPLFAYSATTTVTYPARLGSRTVSLTTLRVAPKP